MSGIDYSRAYNRNLKQTPNDLLGKNTHAKIAGPERASDTVCGDIKLRQWKWKLTKPYNGFISYERIRGWQVTHWLIDIGELPDPKSETCSCSICGKTKGVNYHNENYYEPWTAKLVCQSCHYFIHTRFRIEHALPVLRKRAGTNESAQWVYSLSKERINLAEQLREKHGDQVREFPELIASYPTFPIDQLQELVS